MQKPGNPYGTHRVLEPKDSLPQAALRVDNDFTNIFDNEILCDVTTLNIDFVLGVPGGMSGNINNLLYLVGCLKPAQSWSVASIGKCQLPLTTHAIAMGGHVHVGLEDSIYYRKGQLAKNNAQFVGRVVRISTELNRPIATVDQAREALNL